MYSNKRRRSELEIDDDAKEIVREIGTAINESVENSTKVAEAIERLREAGYEMELTLRLEIGLRPHAGDDALRLLYRRDVMTYGGPS